MGGADAVGDGGALTSVRVACDSTQATEVALFVLALRKDSYRSRLHKAEVYRLRTYQADQPTSSGLADQGWGAELAQQLEDGRVLDARTQGLLECGWIWVSRPRSRLLMRVASPARSSSKPTIISSSATVSSSSSIERRVCGIDRAASAMTNASQASVLASPGQRSAIRPIVRPSRYATAQPMSLATAIGRAPIEAGCCLPRH